MDEAERKRRILELIETAEVVYLTTVDADGYPRTRAMLNLRNREQYPRQAELFAAHANDLLAYFTTNTSSSKLRDLAGNPRACAYYCHPRRFRGVALVGDIEVVKRTDIRQAVWQEGWVRYYPGGPDDPDHSILCLRPKYATGWYESETFRLDLSEAEVGKGK
jgi:general stress protein 26